MRVIYTEQAVAKTKDQEYIEDYWSSLFGRPYAEKMTEADESGHDSDKTGHDES